MSEFRIKKDQAGEWRWKFKADNGKIVADSGEGYKNEDDCKRGIELVKTQAPTALVHTD